MKYEQARTSMDAPMQDRLDLSYADNFLADESYEADAGIRKAERQRLVNILLGALTKEQREIIHLYYWDHKTQNDIAERLNCTRRRVGQMLNEALDDMKTFARAHNISP